MARLRQRSDGEPPLSGTIAATRVADVLLTVATSQDVGVSELARSLHLSKSVTHRILRSLAARSLVARRHDGTYEIGIAAAILGARSLQGLDLRIAALPVLRSLQEETGETATVSALIGSQRVFIDQIPSPHSIKMIVELGRSYPLHAGATGKAILALAPPDLRRHVLTHPRPTFTNKTLSSRAALERALDEVRSDGVAVSHGERDDGAAAVAAPIFGLDDTVVGAISVCGPAARFREAEVARYKRLVKHGAAETATRLRTPDARLIQ